MHGPPLPLAEAGGFAEQLGHHPARLGPTHDGLGVFAVGREDIIILVQPCRGPYRHRLLPAVEMQETGDVPLGVLLGAGLLKLARQHHLLVQPQQLLIGQNRPQSGFHKLTPVLQCRLALINRISALTKIFSGRKYLLTY